MPRRTHPQAGARLRPTPGPRRGGQRRRHFSGLLRERRPSATDQRHCRGPRGRRRRPHSPWPPRREGPPACPHGPAGRTERQAGRGVVHHPDASRRRQDDRHHRAGAGPRADRPPRRRRPPRALDRPVPRREGRRDGGRALPGGARRHDQPPLHRRHPRGGERAQPPGRVSGQSPLLRQPASHRSAPDPVPPGDGHERPGAPRDRARAGGPLPGVPPRGGVPHHGGLRGDGPSLPRRGPRGSQDAPRPDPPRLHL